MSDRRVENAVADLHAAPEPSPAHREALRGELLVQFRARTVHPPVRRWLRRRTLVLLVACAVLLLGASRWPVHYAVKIGERVIFHAAEVPPDWPTGLALRDTMATLVRPGDSHVWAMRGFDGGITLYVDLLTHDASAGQVAAKLMSTFPALRGAKQALAPLEAETRGTLVDAVGRRLHYGPRPGVVERARQEFRDRLPGD